MTVEQSQSQRIKSPHLETETEKIENEKSGRKNIYIFEPHKLGTSVLHKFAFDIHICSGVNPPEERCHRI